MPLVNRPRGQCIHYEIDDFTDPWKNASVIVLQHGLGRSSRLWYGWIPYLSRFYKVVRPDLRGFGRSSFESNTALSVKDYIDDLLAIIDHVNADSVHYCGDSFGGILGMTLAAQHAARIRTLTLLSSPIFLDEQNLKGVTLGRESWQAALNELGPQGWSEAMHNGVLIGGDADESMVAWFAADMGTSRLDTLLAMSALAMSVDATPCLAQIKAPVLGLYPTHGTLTSSTQEKLLTENIKDLRLVRLPSRYHMAQHIAPAACANYLLHFAAQFDGITCRE